MKPVESSVVINRLIQECFAYLTDLRNDVEWRRATGVRGEPRQAEGHPRGAARQGGLTSPGARPSSAWTAQRLQTDGTDPAGGSAA